MKTILINASPRKDRNTAQLLKNAMLGAQQRGDEIEYIELYDLLFTGCRSCLVCKRVDIAQPCKCYWNDALSPILERMYRADRLIIGSPIYFGEPTAQLRALMERLVFPALSYDNYSSTFTGKIDIDIILTMNATGEYYKKAYEKRMKEYFAPLHFLNGTVHILPVTDTMQVDNYANYRMAGFSAAHKAEVHETFFPEQLTYAYQLGAGTFETNE